jgi:hypothetical protein
MPYRDYRLFRPKIEYQTAREAATALKELEKYNREAQNNYSNARSKLMVYYNRDLHCYQLGHCRKHGWY